MQFFKPAPPTGVMVKRDASDVNSKFRPLMPGEAIKTQGRYLVLRAEDDMKLDIEARTLELSWSSEYPVERWYGNEILSHEPGAADLSRLNNGAPLLFNHNPDDIIGVVEKAWIDNVAKKGRAIVRFARTPRGDKMMGMVEDKVLRNVSFLYQVHTFIAETGGDGRATDDTYTATDWLAFEISMVTIPADPTVGVGRSRVDALPARAIRLELRQRTPDPNSSQPATNNPAAAAAITSMRNLMNLRQLAALLGIRIADGADEAAIRAAICHHLNIDANSGDDAINAAVAKRFASTGDAATQAERDRIKAIRSLCAKHNIPAKVREKMITDGVTIEAARGLVLDHLSQGGSQPVARLGYNVDMTERERRSFSFVRACAAALSNDWQRAGFEREVSRTIAQQLQRDPRGPGFFMPTNLPFAPTPDHLRAFRTMAPQHQRAAMFQRAIYQVGTAAQGGNLVETDLLAEDFIEALRNVAIVTQLGARILSGLVGNVDIPRQAGVSQMYWVAESGGLTESEATFDKVQLRPKTAGVLSKMSRLAMQQTTPAIEMLARMDILATLALGLDRSVISGTGTSNQPLGVTNQSGVSSIVGGVNGANITFDNMIQLKTAPRVANAPYASPAFAFNARTAGYLETLKDSNGSYLWVPNGGGVGSPVPGTIRGESYAISNQLRGNLTKGSGTALNEVIYGNWSEVLIGEWGSAEVLVNPYENGDFESGDVRIRVFQTIDAAVRHGESFAVMSDAATPGF